MGEAMDKQLRSLARRARLAVARGIVRLVADGGGLQLIQLGLMGNETRSNLERVQEYGFSSHPHAGAEAAVIFVGGNRDHGLIVGVDDRRYRIKGLSAGEVAIYTDEGDSIILKRGKLMEINTNTLVVKAGIKVRMETPELEVTGDIIDRCDTNPNTIHGMREIYNIHEHPENDGGGPTDEPNEQM